MLTKANTFLYKNERFATNARIPVMLEQVLTSLLSPMALQSITIQSIVYPDIFINEISKVNDTGKRHNEVNSQYFCSKKE